MRSSPSLLKSLDHDMTNPFMVLKDVWFDKWINISAYAFLQISFFLQHTWCRQTKSSLGVKGKKFLVSFVLFLMIVHVKLTAFYISYLLFSSCCQIFAGDASAVWKSLVVCRQNLCQTLIFFFSLFKVRGFHNEVLLSSRSLWCNLIHLHGVSPASGCVRGQSLG